MVNLKDLCETSADTALFQLSETVSRAYFSGTPRCRCHRPVLTGGALKHGS